MIAFIIIPNLYYLLPITYYLNPKTYSTELLLNLKSH